MLVWDVILSNLSGHVPYLCHGIELLMVNCDVLVSLHYKASIAKNLDFTNC